MRPQQKPKVGKNGKYGRRDEHLDSYPAHKFELHHPGNNFGYDSNGCRRIPYCRNFGQGSTILTDLGKDSSNHQLLNQFCLLSEGQKIPCSVKTSAAFVETFSH